MRGEAANAVVVTLASGKVLLVGPHGEKRATMRLDLPTARILPSSAVSKAARIPTCSR
jgi:hypothetical protein